MALLLLAVGAKALLAAAVAGIVLFLCCIQRGGNDPPGFNACVRRTAGSY
jgi:hypothetical protein